jgi:hypothetical protein
MENKRPWEYKEEITVKSQMNMNSGYVDKRIHGRDPHGKLITGENPSTPTVDLDLTSKNKVIMDVPLDLSHLRKAIKPCYTVLVLDEDDFYYLKALMENVPHVLSSKVIKVQERFYKFITEYNIERVFRSMSNQNNVKTFTVLLMKSGHKM